MLKEETAQSDPDRRLLDCDGVAIPSGARSRELDSLRDVNELSKRRKRRRIANIGMANLAVATQQSDRIGAAFGGPAPAPGRSLLQRRRSRHRRRSLRISGAYRAGDVDGLARSLAAAFGPCLEAQADGSLLLTEPDPTAR